MDSCNLRPRPYPMLHRARAFVRGLPKAPFVEVALEGIMGGRSLSQLQEFKYATRLAEHGTTRFLCRTLECGASKTIQDIFASAIRKRFEEKLCFMSVVSYALWQDGHPISTFYNACRQDAEGLAVLRGRISNALASGNVTSEVAQKDLVSILRIYNIADGHFGPRVPELKGHEAAVLASPKAPDDLKKLLVREMADSRSIARKGLLGLPLTPYDFENQM